MLNRANIAAQWAGWSEKVGARAARGDAGRFRKRIAMFFRDCRPRVNCLERRQTTQAASTRTRQAWSAIRKYRSLDTDSDDAGALRVPWKCVPGWEHIPAKVFLI